MTCKYVIPEMKRVGGGAIVNTASIWGVQGAGDQAAYCAAKGGVVLLTKSLAIECAPHGIRVNCVCPGYTRTLHSEEWFGALDEPEKEREEFLSDIPMGRPASADEIANVSLYLVSDEAAFVTGHVLMVDGGYTTR